MEIDDICISVGPSSLFPRACAIAIGDVRFAAPRDPKVKFTYTSILYTRHPLLPSIPQYINNMASRILNPALFHLRTPLMGAALGFSGALLIQQTFHSRRLLRLDSSPSSVSPKDWSFSQYQHDASTPVLQESGGLNPKAIRQLSIGSILGMPLCPMASRDETVTDMSDAQV